MKRFADQGMRQIIRTRIRGVKWMCVEMGLALRGVPDMQGILMGREVWVECKATQTRSIRYQAGQIGWMYKHAQEGGRCFVAVRRRHEGGKRLGPPIDEIWLIDGGMALQSEMEGLVEGAPYVLYRCGGAAECWDWRRIKDIMFDAGPIV